MRWIFYESPLSGRMLSILRIIAGIIFVSFGTMKLFGYPPSPTPIGPVDLNSQLGIAGMLEVVGGLAIVFGLLTRPVAFVLSGEMAVAYFQAHFPRNFWPVLNGGENVVLFCFVFLYLFVTGAGPYSLDALLRSRRHLHASSADRTARDRRPAVAAERL